MAKKRSGKDTLADYLVSKYGFQKMSLADPLKDATKTLFGFSDDQLYGNLKEEIDENWNVSPRVVLQYLGTEVFRRDITKIMPDIEDNFWIKCMKVKYLRKMKETPNAKFCIADVRFPNEVRTIRELGGIIIKIERPSLEGNDSHESEKYIDQIKDYNYRIINDASLEDLYEKMDHLMHNRV